jgi:glycosyltransferase involved in cell wall biosynthesis
MSNDKVIYIANYRDGTGWANAALNNILAMDHVGINVVPRCITYEGSVKNVPERILELEQQSTSGAKTCIQHTLPSMYTANKGMRNIAFYETETTSFRKSLWWKYINNMDAAFVPNREGVFASQLSFVDIPTHVVPHCLPVENYNRDEELAFHAPELDNHFNFLFVGELVERKNLEALIKAFHGEFHPKEKVNLVIKTKIPNAGGQNPFVLSTEYCNQIKDKLKIRKNYMGEMIFADHLPKDAYLSIFRQCHCFVMPSRGEACCIPALEAGLMNLPVLYTSNNGMRDYVGIMPEGYSSPINEVKSDLTQCYNALDTLPDIQGGDELWQEVNVMELRDKMRGIFEMHKHDIDRYNEQASLQREKSLIFNYENVGNRIKELL